MTAPLIYIATRYADAHFAHTVVRQRMIDAGCGVTSTWHAPPWSPEDLSTLDARALHVAHASNMAGIAAATVLLAIDAPGMREGYAEAEAAWTMGVRVVWLGRPHLSAAARHASGEWRVVDTLDDAVRECARPWVEPRRSHVPALVERIDALEAECELLRRAECARCAGGEAA